MCFDFVHGEAAERSQRQRCFLFYSTQRFLHGQRKTLVLCCTGRQKYTRLPCERCMQGSGSERQIKSFAEGHRYYSNVSTRCFGESYTSSHRTQIIRCPSNLRTCCLLIRKRAFAMFWAILQIRAVLIRLQCLQCLQCCKKNSINLFLPYLVVQSTSIMHL